MASNKTQIPASSGPGYKAPSPKPSNASTPLGKPVAGHSRGKDSKSK
jgi:hypothetical protein